MHRRAWAPRRHLIGLAVIATILGLNPETGISHPDISEAEDGVAHALEKSPNDPVLHLQRAMLQREREDWDGCAASYTTAAALGADPDITDVSLASALMEAGLPKTALARINIAIDRNADNGVAVLARARIYSRSKQLTAAASDYARAIELLDHPQPNGILEAMTAQIAVTTPDAVVSHGEMAADTAKATKESANAREKQVLAALAVADSAMSKVGVVSSIQSRAIEFEIELERYDFAVARVDSMLAQAPRHEIWIAQRGDLLMAQGKTDEAAKTYDHALALLRARPAGRLSSKLAALEQELAKKLASKPESREGENP